MRLGINTHPLRTVLSTTSVGPKADAHATRQAVLTTTVTPVYDDGKTSHDQYIYLAIPSISRSPLPFGLELKSDAYGRANLIYYLHLHINIMIQ